MRSHSTASAGCLLSGLVLLLQGGALDASESPPAGGDVAAPAVASLTGPAPEEEEELEEVIVRGTRLWQLREAIVEAEDRFFARYNELNKNDDFDIHCRREAPLGTRLKKRICRVAFFEDAQAEYARTFVTGVGFAPDPDLVMLERSDEFRDNAVELYRSDRRLRALSRDLERLRKKYEEERKERFKDRWILLE